MKNTRVKMRTKLALLLACSLTVGTLPIESIMAKAAMVEENALMQEKVLGLEEYENNELVVVYKEENAEIEELSDKVEEEKITENCSLLTVDSKQELSKTLELLEQDETVAYVQPNYPYYRTYTNDEYSSLQWAYYGNYNINQEKAWSLGSGVNQEVIVAVVDSGIDYQHEELKEAMWLNSDEIAGDGMDNDKNGYIDDIYGWNFFDGTADICKYEYSRTERDYVDVHGTHIAGIIAAMAENGEGIAGIASQNNVKLMSVKVMGDGRDGNGVAGYSTDIIKAITYAQENGATICNLSLGYSEYDKALYETMENSNMLFVCAAGNGTEKTHWIGWDIDKRAVYPAAFELSNIISVANMNSMGVLDESTCYGAISVDIAAPGTSIVSTAVGGRANGYQKYAVLSGTSMAAPMVTGVAALMASYFGETDAVRLKESVLSGATENIAFGNKIANNRMLNAEGAFDYYQNKIWTEFAISKVSKKSNNKKVTVNIKAVNSPVTTVLYERGNLEAAYFEGGVKGTALEYSDNAVCFEVKESGDYTIYVLCDDGTEVVEKVSVNVPTLKKVTLSASKKTVKIGKTYQLKVTVNPSDIYKKVTYKSSNSKVATVSSKGKIKAKKKGTANITVTVKDGNTVMKKVCKITVK